MRVKVFLSEDLAQRVPVDRINELLGPYCQGYGLALPDDPGPGTEALTVELQPALAAALKSKGIPPDEAVRRVLAANAKPDSRPRAPGSTSDTAQPMLTVPAPEPRKPRNLPPIFAVLLAMLLPLALIVGAFILLRRFPASRGGGGFDEWAGGA